MFSALRFRNFRLLWLGLAVSFTGSFMQQAAILWHVSLLAAAGHKGMALGMVGLVRAAPVIVFSLFAGVAADAFDRRKLMLITQCGGTLVAALLSTLAFTGVHTLWPVYLLAAAGAAVGAFDPPARHSLVPMLVPREELPNAIGLNTAMIQIASVAGPAIGGVLIGRAGVAWAYAVNAVSFLFVVVALVLMRDLPKRDGTTSHPKGALSLSAAADGLGFVFREPIIRSTMLIDFCATFFGSAMTLLPIYAQDILHVGARGYGWLAAAPAAGAVVTSLVMLPMASRVRHQGQVLLWAIGAYGMATVIFGLSRTFWLTFFCLALTGAADIVSTIVRNLVRQLRTPDALRGRMMGVNMVFFLGGPQLGELEAGAVAQWLGAPTSVITGGLGCLVATAAIAAMAPELRAYQERQPPTVAPRPIEPPRSSGRPETSAK